MNDFIVFLDIDGVLADWVSYHQYSDLLNRKCICCLNRLTDSLKADIVISSTWRFEGLNSLTAKLKEAGVKAKIIGATEIHFEDKGRGTEIVEWIAANNYIGDYLVLDDEVSDICKKIPKGKILHIKDGMSKGGLTDRIVDKCLEAKK